MPPTDRAHPGERADRERGERRADGVRRAVEPAVAATGLVLEAVTVAPAGRRSVVRVVVDLPDDATGSLDLDQVAAVSREVSEVLDAPAGDAVLGGAPYVLEVTSPGVDRPLTERRHWARARGRLVAVEPAGAPGAGPTTGRVERVDDDGVLLGGVLLPWAALEGAAGRVQVEFQRADDGDADDSGADDSAVDDAVDVDGDGDSGGTDDEEED